jgi:predicted DNA-binding transcriptional regulator YafY
VARDTYDERIKFYGLDRLTNLEVQKTHYEEDTDFDINEHLRYCFGIIIPEDKTPSEIVLSFEPLQGKYIKSLPLHPSQKILIDNEEEVRISLQLYLTHDFIMEVLSYGKTIKVVAPQHFVENIKKIYSKALKKY